MKISMMKTLCSLAALALCWSSPRTSLAQQPAPQAGARLWTIKSVGTETATPDVYYLLMKMEYQSGLAAEATTQGEKRLSDFLAAVDALKIPNFSYRICNNLITPASDQQVTGMVYTRNVVFKLMSSQAGQPLPGRDAIIAKLEDLGARYNSHCVTCIGSGWASHAEGVVFSVREADELYRRALDKAWAAIDARLQELTASTPGKKPKLLEVSYDPLPGESTIEELPDVPKSSRPQAVEVSVRVIATYTLQ